MTMTKKQKTFVQDAISNIQMANKWVDIAMRYSGEQITEDDNTFLKDVSDKLTAEIKKLQARIS